jgi:hypothetical protein
MNDYQKAFRSLDPKAFCLLQKREIIFSVRLTGSLLITVAARPGIGCR